MNDEPTNLASTPEGGSARPRSGTLLVAAVGTFFVAVTLYLVLGMPGMDHRQTSPSSGMEGMDMGPETAAHRLVDPATFAASIAHPGAVVINVHIPYDGEITGTDIFMPFDNLDVASLPADRTTPLVVYCRSGTMSAIAVGMLTELGYTDIVELAGGMRAWESSGRPITHSSTPGP